MTSFNLADYFQQQKATIDNYLKTCLPAKEHDPTSLFDSMHYSLFAKGKRIRPILCLAAAEAMGISSERVLPAAAALEMIHVFSLVHDDLPAMDDDDLRRGQPTNHKVYGEAIAILAGDNLLSQAFSILTRLADHDFAPKAILNTINEYALLTGSNGMIVGQVIDIESEGKQISLDRLKKLHGHKTGALIRLSVIAPALLSESDPNIIDALNEYGNSIGLAFQIADDILDIEGDESLGKDLGSDIEKGKATYPALMGLEEAKQEAKNTLQKALDSLAIFGDRAEPLKQIARFIVDRKN